MVNKYDKDMTEIRLDKVLKNYVRKDDLNNMYTTTNRVDIIQADVNRLDDKIDNNDKNVNAMISKIVLCLKIVFVILFIQIVFGVLLIVSYFKLESSIKDTNTSVGSVDITYEYERI